MQVSAVLSGIKRNQSYSYESQDAYEKSCIWKIERQTFLTSLVGAGVGGSVG